MGIGGVKERRVKRDKSEKCEEGRCGLVRQESGGKWKMVFRGCGKAVVKVKKTPYTTESAEVQRGASADLVWTEECRVDRHFSGVSLNASVV